MHCFSDEEMVERASLYALGALSQWEARAFEEHLDEGCERCAAELQSFEEVAGSLFLGVPESAPPASSRERLLSLVRAEGRAPQPAPVTGAEELLVTLRGDEGQWHTIGKGIRIKHLFTDPQTSMVTTLVKMEPGARIPLHHHRGIEQCYVIEGDFHAANQRLGAGDFHIAKAGSVHEPVYTLEGALVLIIAPKEYEALEQHSA